MIVFPRLLHRPFTVLTLALGLLVACVLSPSAYANSYAGLNHIQNIINSTPGVQFANVASGMAATSTSGVTVTTASGMRIPVPVSATATVSKSALALNAARLVRGATVLGLAYEGYEVYKWLKERGVKTCAPPDFFCKPSNGSPTTGTSFTYYGSFGSVTDSNAEAACNGANSARNAYAASVGSTYVNTITRLPSAANGYACEYFQSGSNGTGVYPSNNVCTNGSSFVYTSETPCGSGGGNGGDTGTPATTDQELADYIASVSGFPSGDMVKLHESIRKDNARQNVLTPEQIVPPSTPVEVTAPPVTTPKTVVKTETVVQPDGSTVKRETEEQVTVIPNIPWKRLDDEKTAPVSFAEQKTQVVTDTDPVTGTKRVVSTTTETPTPVTEPAKEAAEGPVECGSPGRPKCAIDETGTPDGKTATKTAEEAFDKTTTDILTGIEAGKSDAGKSVDLGGWMPVMPPGMCTDPAVQNPGTGGMETVKICDKLAPITLGMELLWAGFFGFAIMGLISNAMSKSA